MYSSHECSSCPIQKISGFLLVALCILYFLLTMLPELEGLINAFCQFRQSLGNRIACCCCCSPSFTHQRLWISIFTQMSICECIPEKFKLILWSIYVLMSFSVYVLLASPLRQCMILKCWYFGSNVSEAATKVSTTILFLDREYTPFLDLTFYAFVEREKEPLILVLAKCPDEQCYYCLVTSPTVLLQNCNVLFL